MKELEYPFDSKLIMKKKKSLKRRLEEESAPVMKKRIAVLGGSTTADIVAVLGLFLRNYGIEAEFYECGYNQFRQEALFPSLTFARMLATVLDSIMSLSIFWFIWKRAL